MSKTKKTLIVKISHDVSSIPDAAISHHKAGIKATMLASGFKEDQIDLEVVESNDEEPSDILCSLFQSLFERILGSDEDEEIVHDEE